MSLSSPQPSTAGAKAALTIGALGVVFGDIGTSPLYTMKECISALTHSVFMPGSAAGIPVPDITPSILGVLSLMFWLLVLIVCLKYLYFVVRADNEGEGGIFALLALLHARGAPNKGRLGAVAVMILIGAALLYGDGIITPAISVLGAVQGLKSISPSYDPYVTWMAAAILFVLFWFQHKGTMRIGRIFGPVMLIWFVTLGALGLVQVLQYPQVLRALNPTYAIALLTQHPLIVSAILGAVVLTITGTEALYADMGHFGRKSIMLAWYGAAFPGLVLNYFGQGAYLLGHPQAIFEPGFEPFFALASQGLPRVALTLLSVAAAIIASQALITGAYSLTRQAIQLGYFPRLAINYTSAAHASHIYVPFVNSLLAIGSITTVAIFRSTDNLAAAYGIAVTGTMVITTVAFYLVVRRLWDWPAWFAAPVCGLFLVIDLALFGANLHKVHEGGWFTIAIAAGLLAVMHTWRLGRDEIYKRVYGNSVTESELTSIARSQHIVRVSGAAVFMVGSPSGTPIALLHHVKSNRSLHKIVVLLTIVTEEVPTIPVDRQLTVTEVGEGLWRAVGRYGYMESPDVGELMERIRDAGVPMNPQQATFFFNREMIIKGGNARMWEWQKSLYGFLSRNARPVRDYYRITPSQIIEIGLPIQL